MSTVGVQEPRDNEAEWEHPNTVGVVDVLRLGYQIAVFRSMHTSAGVFGSTHRAEYKGCVGHATGTVFGALLDRFSMGPWAH